MIHKYYLNDNFIVLDVESGSVHVVDELTYDILDDYTILDKNALISKHSKKYNKSDIETAIGEIEILISEELLFSEKTNYEDIEYNPTNIVKAMCLHVAHDCNLKCKYCFAAQGNFKGERALMSLETGKKSLEFLAKNSGNRRNLEVDFFGGEPLMNFDVVKELVHYGRELEKIYNKNFRFTITTNGVLLTDDKIEFINEHMDNVVLSLDGRKEVNDYIRPTLNDKGSFDLIVPKFKKLIDTRGEKDYYIRGTFTKFNKDFRKDLKAYYDLGFKKVSIEPVVTDPNEPYALTEEDLYEILKEYEEFSKDYLDIRKTDKDFLFFHYMIDLSQGPCVVKRLVGCGAGSEYIAITPEGDIYPCHQFVGEKEFLMGNLEEGITNIKLRDNFKCANVLNKTECDNCFAKYYCSGGCHANAFFNNGDFLKPYELGCEMERKRVECSISILANEI
ncbi:MAG: thioether cross-link-forming SCIFF peptide maturase [Tissierellia bacterium]|nr:thioether cross-link-forming SCIFF peptide maturase [Tissierellia bacterium]